MARDIQQFVAKLDQGKLWSSIDKGHERSCWEAIDLPEHSGYPYFKGYKLSHVLFWLKYGRGPDKKKAVTHTCCNCWCCNPSHIVEGTRGDLQKVADRSARAREANRAKRLEKFGTTDSVLARIQHRKEL